jgi:alkylation response protein AidB-like acyl-CoA dehydrogenase
MLQTDTRTAYDADLDQFRDQVRKVFDKHITPNLDRWETAGIVDRAAWLAMGEAGLLCPNAPVEYGGLGLDFRYNAVICEELGYIGCHAGFPLQSDVVLDYFTVYGSDELKRAWIPKMISGEVITAIAMTEPDAGSDLQGIKTTAVRDGDHYVINGSKIWTSGAQFANWMFLLVRTDESSKHNGITFLLLDMKTPGVEVKPIQLISGNSMFCEVFLNDVRAETRNVVGAENQGWTVAKTLLNFERSGMGSG